MIILINKMHLIFRPPNGLQLLALLCIISRACNGLKCYMGVTHKNSPVDYSTGEPVEVQCSSRYQHRQEIAKHDGSLSHINVTYSLQSSDTDDGSEDAEITNCIIFYNAHTDKADFACDHDNICHDAMNTMQVSMCYKGSRGSLYCCQGDMCNTESNIRHLSRPQAATICYNGTNTGKVDISESRCMSSWCYQSSTYMTNERLIEQKFGCDAECDNEDFELNEATCRQRFLHGGIHQRICYCSTDRCNSLVSLITSESADEIGRVPPTVPPRLKMHNPDYDRHVQRQWLIVGGWVGAAILSLLMITLMAIIIRKGRVQRLKQVSSGYSHLISDDVDAAQQRDLPNDEKVIVA